MKITIYAHYFPPKKGGVQYSNLEIAKGLKSLGHDIEVITCRNKGVDTLIQSLDFPVYLFPIWPKAKMHSLSKGGRINWIFVYYYYLIVSRHVKKFDPDVLLVADETANCFWGVWGHKLNINYVSYCTVPFINMKFEYSGKRKYLGKLRFRFDEMVRYFFKRWMLKSYGKSKYVGVVSSSTKENLLEAFPEIKNKIVTIPRSIDDRFFKQKKDIKKINSLKKEMNISEEEFVMLSVSELAILKGIDDVLRALKIMMSENDLKVKYIVIGKGKSENELKRLANRFEIGKNVIFKGEIKHSELIYYYDMSDIFVLPSKRGVMESFGRVFVEAGARGKPSIGVNRGGMVDVIDDKKTGFLISPGDYKKLYEAIMYLICHPNKAKEMGNMAYEKSKKYYTSQSVALKYEKVLRKACD